VVVVMETGDSSLAEENFRLREELSRCKDDKEFVWMLWKDLQKQSPDLTSTVDMIITREELKNEQRMKELTAEVQTKQEEAQALAQNLEENEKEVIQKNAKLERMKTEVASLEQKLKSLELERQKQADEERVNLLNMKEQCVELESQLEEERRSLFVHHEEVKRLVLGCEEHTKQIDQLKSESENKDIQIQQLKQEKSYLKKTVEDLSKQRDEQKQTLQRQEAELQSAKRELTEVANSRDAWANHSTLQSTAVQQLQKENTGLREELLQLRGKKKRRGNQGREMETWNEQKRDGERVLSSENQIPLERVEKELFETQLQLEAKCKELEGLRSCHDRRAKRMQALQASQALLEEQLRTYTTETRSSSCTPWEDPGKRKATPAKDLRHENSTAVWNELAAYREKCQQLETHLQEIEEERDALQAKCLRSESCLAELRTQLEHGRNDLERKLSAIARAEEASVSVSVHSRQLKLKVKDLESSVSKLKQEKTKLISQHSCSERELYRLREEAAQMQAQIMSLAHRKKLEQLQTFSRGTMTDEGASCRYDSSIDSATQVDLRDANTRSVGVSPIKLPVGERFTEGVSCNNDSSSISVTDSATQVVAPDTVSTGVSPIKPPPRQTRENSTQTSAPVERRIPDRQLLRAHSRTRSEGDSMFYRRKAKDALRRVKKISKELLDISLPVKDTAERGTKSANPSEGEESAPEIKPQCRCKTVERMVNTGKHMPGARKCAFQQQVKMLQKNIRALRQQLISAGTARQCLTQSLEEERREGGKARAEVKELNVRLQGMKTVVQSLQSEVHRLQDSNQQLQQKLTSLSETKKGRTDSDWKRIESEKRVLSEKCSVLTESVKSLEERVQQKTCELTDTQERLVRLERDVRQKRQLLDSQRDKLKTLTQQAEDNQAKVQSMERETNTLKESLDHSRHKVDCLQMQLSREKEDKTKAVKLLTSCQRELSHTVEQLAVNQEDSKKKQKQLEQARESHELQLKTLKEKHAEKVEFIHQRLRDREKEMKDQLKQKELFLREHRQFVKVCT
jgi:chromosome segregation ATPase